MAGGAGEVFLNSIGDYFISTGMVNSCFNQLNTDEGWEIGTRNATTHELMWDPNQYPSGIPNFTASLAARGLKFGLYGAASGVTCGGISGQLGYEDLDVATFVRWGVSYLKSDNCATYAMDSSVRFAATRDALLRAKAPIVYSIEPFSIAPDIRQSSAVANLYRVAKDIDRTFAGAMDRANTADKWAPLAGPGAFSDPDMINLDEKTAGETRAHFGINCIAKAPLLLSSNLPKLPAAVQSVITNPEIVAINQDALAVQARKLLLGAAPLPWLVGFERCDAGAGGGLTGLRSRGWAAPPGTDTRIWSTPPHGSVPGAVLLYNNATQRCLSNGTAAGLATVVLLPCAPGSSDQAWTFTPNAATVAALVHASTGLALAIGNSTLWSGAHGSDALPTPDAAYGEVALGLAPYTPTQTCTARDCEGYHPEQLWYYDALDAFIAQSTYTASINHCFAGSCYELTARQPTTEHRCLAHVLSIANAGTDAAATEVWGGPLAGGAYVLAMLNTGDADALIVAPFAALEAPGVGAATTFCVRDIWARADVGAATGAINATVPSHDLAVFKLTPAPCA